MIAQIFKFLGGFAGINALLGRFFKDKDAVEANIHAEQISAQEALAAEFQHRGQRYWFDALVDGLNRLPRPLFALWLFALWQWALIDPFEFILRMKAYEAVPEWFALLSAQIILLYFGGRMLDKWPSRLKGMTAAEFKTFIDQMAELKSLKEQAEQTKQVERTEKVEVPAPSIEKAPIMDPQRFDEEMADESHPLSNAAIEEWNRRRRIQNRGRQK